MCVVVLVISYCHVCCGVSHFNSNMCVVVLVVFCMTINTTTHMTVVVLVVFC